MGKIKIHEVAKELGLTSKEVLEVANGLNIEAKSHLSGIEKDEVERIEKAINKKSDNKKETKKQEVNKDVKKTDKKEEVEKSDNKKGKSKEKVHNKKDEKAPIIIRREVVIAEDEVEIKKEVIKKEEKKNNIGFVERKQNNDFNIVYRNKQNKPMTVSELFGLKNDETKDPQTEEVINNEVKNEKENKEEIVSQNNNEKENKEVTKKDDNFNEKGRTNNNIDNNNNYRNNNNNFRNNNNNNNNNNYRNNNNNNNFRNNDNNNNTNNNFRNNNNNTNNNFRNNDNNNNTNNNFRNNNNNTNNNFRNNDNNTNNNFRNNNNNTNNNFRNNNNNTNNNFRNNNNNTNNNFRNNNNNTNNNFRNNDNNTNNNFRNNDNNNTNNFRNNDNRNNSNNNYRNNNNNYNNNYNNRSNGNNGDRFGKRPLDEKGIEKNIKNIISMENNEKESVREYNRGLDKQKNTKFDENKTTKKTKNKKGVGNKDFDEGKLKSLKQANRLSNMFNDQEGGMLDYYDLTTERGRRGRKRNNKNQEERVKQKIFKLMEIEIPETITVKDLAIEMKKTTAEVIKKILNFGIMATINNDIDFDTAYLIAQEFGINAIKKEIVTEEDVLFDDSEDREEDLQIRPPVIVVMGHVDHGKTSLLDAVRKTNVIEGEAGGITQAIGAYKVKINDREITFLDTPGHEAFTSMRARGAKVTDIAILVVAANDGVKPQTIEAINHAKSAEIPIIVAVNKIDLPDSNIEKVKQELMAYELVSEEWGGDTIFVPISAKHNQNIDQLLEMVLLQADMLELKVNPKKQSKGTVIEARLDKTKGPIATMLVQRGVLDIGDTIVVGSLIGRIRAMVDDKGKSVKTAGPSTPVEIMGLTEVPEAGETFYEVKNEKIAKHLIERRKRQAREKAMNLISKVTLENLFSHMEEGNLKVLNLIVKADVQGSVEAVKQSLEKLQNEEVRVKVIHAAAGAVNQSDVTLAKVSKAIIIAFNVRPDNTAREMSEKEEVEIKQYSVIYQAIEDVEAAMKGMLDPKFEEKVIGNVEVRQIFKISNVGTIAGAYVLSGKVERNAGVRVIRENVVIHEGHLSTLKRFKDDVKEATKGFECGIQVENYNDLKEGDNIEVFIMEEIKR